MARVLTALLAALLASGMFQAKEPKEYPLTLKLLETKSNTSTVRANTTTTDCTTNTAGVSPTMNCTSTPAPDRQRTVITSIVEAGDGNTYEIKCRVGAGGAFFQGWGESAAARSGAPTRDGCSMQPGTYSARWDKGLLKLLTHDSKGKPQEKTFVVLNSRPTTVKQQSQTAAPSQQTAPASTAEQSTGKCNIVSTPVGADILVDGKFAGSTPSLISLKPGTHVITVALTGYTTWMRELTIEGGSEISLNAVLEKNASAADLPGRQTVSDGSPIPVGWKEFAPNGGRFSVILPGTPIPDKLEKNIQGVTVPMFMFTVELGSDTGYLCGYFDLPQVPLSQDVEMHLNEMRDEAIRGVQGKLVKETRLLIGNNLARQIQVKVPGNGFLDSKVLLVEGRAYMLSVLNMRVRNAADIDRFFNSFKLTPGK